MVELILIKKRLFKIWCFLFSWSSFLMTILGTSTLFDFSIASFYDRLFRISLNPFKKIKISPNFHF